MARMPSAVGLLAVATLVAQDPRSDPFSLSEPVPNPALCCPSELTLIANDERPRHVVVVLIDTRGAIVRVLYIGQLARGDDARRISVDPHGLATGSYFVLLRSESFELARRVVIVK